MITDPRLTWAQRRIDNENLRREVTKKNFERKVRRKEPEETVFMKTLNSKFESLALHRAKVVKGDWEPL